MAKKVVTETKVVQAPTASGKPAVTETKEMVKKSVPAKAAPKAKPKTKKK